MTKKNSPSLNMHGIFAPPFSHWPNAPGYPGFNPMNKGFGNYNMNSKNEFQPSFMRMYIDATGQLDLTGLQFQPDSLQIEVIDSLIAETKTMKEFVEQTLATLQERRQAITNKNKNAAMHSVVAMMISAGITIEDLQAAKEEFLKKEGMKTTSGQ